MQSLVEDALPDTREMASTASPSVILDVALAIGVQLQILAHVSMFHSSSTAFRYATIVCSLHPGLAYCVTEKGCGELTNEHGGRLLTGKLADMLTGRGRRHRVENRRVIIK